MKQVLTPDALRGHRALVTGAGRGIGAGIVESLVAAGASAVVNARTDAYAGPLAERLRGEYGAQVHAIAGDATTAQGCRDLAAAAEAAIGPIDILVNALGDAIAKPFVSLPGQDTAALDDEDVTRMLDLNLASAIHMCRAVAPGMIAGKWGRIITISSGYGAVRGFASLAIYAAGKAGLTGLTKSLAQEWGAYGITANTIAPGAFPDPALTPPAQMDWYAQKLVPQIPAGRLGDICEVGPLAAFLASDAAAYISGAEVVFDGGFFA